MLSGAISLTLLGMAQAAAPAGPPVQPPPAVSPPAPKGATRAKPSVPLSWLIGSNDYPASDHGAEGSVDVRLEVGIDGRVSACTITKSSGFQILDSKACRLLTARARFAPARDGEGRPVPDRVSSRVVWREEAEWPPGVPALFVGTMRATPDGKVACAYVVNGSAPAQEECLDDLAAKMSAHARATGRVAEETLVTIVTPEGDSEPAYNGDQGRLAYDFEVLLSVGSAGQILECRVIREEGAASAKYWPPGACEGTEPGVLVFGPEAPRKITIKSRRFERY